MGRSDGEQQGNRIDRGPAVTLPFTAIHATALSCALVALVAAPALAGDGVVELNQTCATQTGCLAGDSAGFPVTINASGSYRLTSDLVVPDANTGGIDVQSSDVAIDLGGFAIRGPVVCTGAPLVCTPSLGSGIGIHAPFTRMIVRDGKVVGMGSIGLSLSSDALVAHVIASSNRQNGISVGLGSTVGDCVASDNGGSGFFLGSAAVIRDSAAIGNATVGISTGTNGVVRGNVTNNNGGAGIQTGISSTIVGNSVRENGTVGIQTGSAATITDNGIYLNGGNGITAGSGSLVRGNAIASNTAIGLSFSSTTSGYRENVINLNGGVTVSGGTNLGNNLCNGSTTCP